MKIIDLSKPIEESPLDYIVKTNPHLPPDIRCTYRVADHEIRFPKILTPDDGKSPHPYSQGRTTSRIEAPLHLGTHIDAPRHPGYGDKETIDQFPLEKFYGPAFFLDMTHKLPGGGITAKELEDAIGKEVKENNSIIIRTGVGRFSKDHPYLELDAAEWIVKKKIGVLVMDTTPSKIGTKDASQMLYKGKVLPVTETINLDKITKKKVILIALPLRIIGVEASPVRAAVVEE